MEFSDLAAQVLGKVSPKQLEGIEPNEWVSVGAIPIFCKSCRLPFVLFVNLKSTEFSSGSLFGCGTCKSITRGIDLPMNEKRFLSDYWNASLGNFETISKQNSLSKTANKRVEGDDIEVDLSAGNEVSPYLKSGLRIVCWLKKEEAQAILKAYKSASTVRTRDAFGREFSVEWFESDDPILEKFNTTANAHLIRHRKNGDRRIGWIYKFEAEFALDALKESNTYEIDMNGQLTGVLVYFDPSSAQSKRYKANVCLLRKRGYKYE